MYLKHETVEQVTEELMQALIALDDPFMEFQKTYPSIPNALNQAFDGLLETVERNLDHPDKSVRTAMHMIDGSILNPLYMVLDGAMTEDESLDSFYGGLRQDFLNERITIDQFNHRVLDAVEVTLMFMAGGFLDLVDRNYRLMDFLDEHPRQ